tara:strand:- start:6252 stop:9185 length:2934 start_codon:yes stop_codon:yes gene_type:complete
MLVIGYDGAGSDATPDMQLLKLNEETDSAEVMLLKGADGVTDLTASDLDYLDVTSSDGYESHPYSAVTIADYTFIANKDKTPALLADTSGGAGMYEREHVKRGLIFVRESAYSSEFTLSMTDSEGTTRDINVFTGTGVSTNDSRKDIKTDSVAGAMHAALESSVKLTTGALFDTGGFSDTYLESTTGIVIRWNDPSTDFLFNGIGGTAALGGSNYSHGRLQFLAQPAATDKVTIVGNGAGTNTRVLVFYANGGTGAGAGGTFDVEIGSTVNQTAENFADACTAIPDVNFTASVVWEDGGYPLVHIVDTVGDVMGGTNAGAISPTNAAGGSVSWDNATNMAGANNTPSSSTAGVRHPIHFQRKAYTASDGVNRTSGSVISWFASYPTKAAADASPIKIVAGDSFGGTMVEVFTETTDRVSILPSTAPNNYLIKVEGDKENIGDDHYIRFTSDNPAATENEYSGGRWKEHLASGLQYKTDPATMPHQLIKVNDTTYKFQPAVWEDKTVGDNDSDAPPSFVGQPINDLFFYKSRLGLLAGESVVMSEVNAPYNFWRTSVINSIDSDRIDITSSVNEITQLNWAIPFANQLVIFADRAQFLLTQGSSGLTPSTAALSFGSSYENSVIAKPVVNDNTIIFAQEKAGASALYEMFATGSTEFSFEALSISEHIPSYIDGKIISIAASSLAQTVVVETDSGDNTLYIYKYYNSGKKRVQSSWSKYEITCDYLKSGHFVSDKFHIIEGHNTIGATAVTACSWILSYMKFDNTDSLTNAVDLVWDVPTGKMTANTPTSGRTRIEAEWLMGGNTDRKADIVVFDKTTNVLYPVDAVSTINDQYVYVTGGIAANANIALGLKFDATYEFSKQYLKRGSVDGKEVAVTDGRTTNKWVEVYFNDTQHLTATVSFPTESDFRASSTKTYTGSFAGGGVIGDQPSETSSLRTSVAARNDLPTITLSSDTHQTVTITGAVFELMHTSRGSRTN